MTTTIPLVSAMHRRAILKLAEIAREALSCASVIVREDERALADAIAVAYYEVSKIVALLEGDS